MTPALIASLAWRESRFARRRLLLFLSAISLGVAALVAVQGFASNMRREVREQARAMLGADVGLSSRSPFGERTEAVLDSVARSGAEIARVISFASMAYNDANGSTRLVQVRAPDPGFPFYGSIETEPADRWAALQEGRNLVVDPALLVALGASVGDSISIGESRFQIIAELRKLPGDVEVASSFAPRVFFRAAAVPETGLLGFGARVEYEAFLRIPDPEAADAFVDDHREGIFRPERVRARTLEDQQERMEEALGRLGSFLGLTGVFALLLGGIGVASAMSAYMARKTDSVAVLRCLGATGRQVLAIFLTQAVVMGLIGALLGVGIGLAVQLLLPRMLEGLLPVDVVIRPDGIAILTGILVGAWTAVVFAMLPLLGVRRVSPLAALRRRVDPLPVGRFDVARWSAGGALALSVLLLIMYNAGDVEAGAYIASGVGATLLLLWVLARATAFLLRRSPRTGVVFAMRQGLANLHRPGNQTTAVVIALGFGSFLIATLMLTQTNILRPLQVETEDRGNLLFFDVQPDQVPGVVEALRVRELPLVQSVPIIPMRILAVDGEPVLSPGGADGAPAPSPGAIPGAEEADPDVSPDPNADGGPGGWAVRREYRSTYRDSLATTETLVAGRLWTSQGEQPTDGVFEVSLDEDIAGELGVGLGARIDWDVQGVTVPTRVTSLRRIDWARLEPNFFAVFEPAALRAVPQMWVMLARADSASERAAIQREVVGRFPNVSAIDLTLVQRALDDVLGRIAMVIRFLAGFSVATGFVVLLGAVAAGRAQRIRESVLLKTLGATRRQIAAILLTEYAALGLVGASVGSILAVGAGWAIARWLLEVEFSIDPAPLLVFAAAIAALSALVGLSASREVFRSTPMEALREEG